MEINETLKRTLILLFDWVQPNRKQWLVRRVAAELGISEEELEEIIKE